MATYYFTYSQVIFPSLQGTSCYKYFICRPPWFLSQMNNSQENIVIINLHVHAAEENLHRLFFSCKP